MSDLIEVRGLRVLGRHGVLDFEQVHAQPFDIDVTLYVDTRVAGRTDNLADSVSYADVVDAAKGIVESQSFALIERLADEIAKAALTNKKVTAVDVTVRKPHASVGASIDFASVTIHRP